MNTRIKQLGLCVVALGFAAFFTGCTTPTSITVQSDPEADFFEMATYAWLPPAGGAPLGITESTFRRAIDAEMELRGFRQVTENPDINLALHLAIEERISGATTQHWGYGWGSYSSWRRHPHSRSTMGTSMSTTQLNTYNQGTLLLDMVNPARNVLVWRGVAERAVSNAARASELAPDIAQQLLAEFPPN